VASSDFGSGDAPPIDFTPPQTHTLVRANIHKKGTFEKLFLEGRPPVAIGVTSGGDLFGGTEVTFSDVLGDKQFNMFASSVATDAVASYTTCRAAAIRCRRTRRPSSTGYDPRVALRSRCVCQPRSGMRRRRRRGHDSGSIPQPVPVRVVGGIFNYEQATTIHRCRIANAQTDQHGRPLFSSGTYMFGALGAGATVFREYGPLAETFRAGYEYAADRRLLSRNRDLDARYYRLATNGGLPARGHRAGVNSPAIFTGGNSELRVTTSNSSATGHSSSMPNCVPLIEAARPSASSADCAVALQVSEPPATKVRRGWTRMIPVTRCWGSSQLPDLDLRSGAMPPASIPGFKLVDGRASYGVGLETFALGFPIPSTGVADAHEQDYETTSSRIGHPGKAGQVFGSRGSRVDWMRL
jgi:hypothetical protein